jgi:hypothetical protein
MALATLPKAFKAILNNLVKVEICTLTPKRKNYHHFDQF